MPCSGALLEISRHPPTLQEPPALPETTLSLVCDPDLPCRAWILLVFLSGLAAPALPPPWHVPALCSSQALRAMPLLPQESVFPAVVSHSLCGSALFPGFLGNLGFSCLLPTATYFSSTVPPVSPTFRAAFSPFRVDAHGLLPLTRN